MILSGQSIRRLCTNEGGKVYVPGRGLCWDDNAIKHRMITPFVERSVHGGKSFGLSVAGYDIRVAKFLRNGVTIEEPIRMQNGDFILASSVERIKMPNDLLCIVHDKSSWAREGLALQNTVLEPGWEGFITLELSFHRPAHRIVVSPGDPIAQLIFHKLDQPAEKPYDGKYQNQADMPVEAINESINNDD